MATVMANGRSLSATRLKAYWDSEAECRAEWERRGFGHIGELLCGELARLPDGMWHVLGGQYADGRLDPACSGGIWALARGAASVERRSLAGEDSVTGLCRMCVREVVRTLRDREDEERAGEDMREKLFIVAIVEAPEDASGKVTYGPSPVMAETAQLAEYAAIAALQKKGKALTKDTRVLVEPFGTQSWPIGR